MNANVRDEQFYLRLREKDVWVEDVAVKVGSHTLYISLQCSQKFNADGSPHVVEIKNWNELYDTFRDFCEQAIAEDAK